MNQAAADLLIASWKEEAKRIGREEDRSGDVILSLFDRSGRWSQPFVDAGYSVIRYDHAHGDDIVRFFPVLDMIALREEGFRIAGLLSAPPCTSFAGSGARWWASQHDKPDKRLLEAKYGAWATEYFDTPLEYAQTLVYLTEVAVEQAQPEDFYVIENPVGRMRSACGLPAPVMTFQPYHYGDPYTKKTQLFGRFNADLPTAHVPVTQAGRIHMASGWDKPQQRAVRSQTPDGFAYAFFMANHNVPELSLRKTEKAA